MDFISIISGVLILVGGFILMVFRADKNHKKTVAQFWIGKIKE